MERGWTRMSCFDFLFPPAIADAEIQVADGRTLLVRFVAKTFKLAKRNDYAEMNAPPGLNGAPLQFVHSHSRTLSMILDFDGRATNTDVRQAMKQVMDLMNVDRQTHAPPVLSFTWQGFSLRCVLERSRMDSFKSLFPD